MSKKSNPILPAHQWIRCEPGNAAKNIHCPDTTEINGSDVLPFLLDMDLNNNELEVKPSQLMAALSLSTEDRLEKMRSPTRKYRTTTRNDPFIRCPEAIIFQNFKCGEIYTTSLVITNQRPVTQCLKIYFEPSRFFTLSMDLAQGNMTTFAPGLSNVFKISFVPTDTGRDFIHEIKFVSEHTQFIVPIYAIGPRPIAHMPDIVTLPPTMVKVESSATIVLRNTGGMQLNYSQILDPPFFCSIPKAILPSDGILEIRYICYPSKPGYITGKARVYFRYDFCITIGLECDVKTVKVDLDSHLVTFEDIFMGLCSRKVLTLSNTSNYPLNFAWKMNEHDDEKHTISKLVDLMAEMKEYEQKRYEKLEYLGIVDGESHANIYERIFEDEKYELIRKQKFLYKSNFFQILPRVGKILPKSTFEFSIVFAPTQNIFYYSAAYLDIEGTERRCRVSLQGYGIGPPVVLTVKTLNAGQIYLTDKHQYELAVRNKGVITATVTYQPKKTDWGGILDCRPVSLTLDPDSTKAFLVLFYSKVHGEFIETLDFKVEESGEPLQCIISGTVICPLLKCLPESVDFGTISVGTCNTQHLYLLNESRVIINFDFEFENDRTIGKAFLDIIPANGKVPAYGKTYIKLLFCSNLTIDFKANVLLVMWKSRQYAIKIPISCKCACPQVICDPKILNIKFCFLNCNYTRTIKLTNQSEFPGFIEYIPQKESEDSSILCVPNQTKLYLEAHQTVPLELQINVSKLGKYELPLEFSVTGGISQTLCTIVCNGQGPVVSYHPDEVDFGKIEVLRRYEERLTLVNDSPIPAKVRVYCKNKSWFHIEEHQTSLELSPEEETEVTVWALFNNPGLNRDTILVEIHQGDVSSIKVSAVGVGTSILCEPPLAPILNFGALLTYKAFAQEVKVSNKGNHRHKILFTKRSTVRSLKETDEDLCPSTFSFTPRYLELDPSTSTSIIIKSFIKKPKKAIEDFYCHALIGKSPQIRTIIQFSLEAEFVDPRMSFSKNDMNFNLDVYNLKAEGKTEDVLQVDNKTGIPLQVHFQLDDNYDNFTFVDGTGSADKFCQDVERTSTLSIHFTPTIKEKRRYSQNARLIVEYGDHPKTDIIKLHGEVMFPTIKLYPDEVTFPCVPLGSTSQKNVVIQNISDMMVEFKWFWLEKSIEIVDLDHDATNEIEMGTCKQNSNEFMMYIDRKVSEEEVANVSLPKESSANEQLLMDEIKFDYDNSKYLEDMRRTLLTILTPYTSKKMEPLKALPMEHSCDDRITKIFSLEPSEGVLKPTEYSIITIAFIPPPNTEVKATAVCKIQGGEEEHLVVTGKCSKLSYRLDKQNVYFGNQIFCEVCSDQFTLTNTGLCAIDFKVVTEELQTMHAEMLDVTPKSGALPPGATVSFKIDYFPGFPGRFTKTFPLELGYLEPVPINVYGYAVFSQVHLSVPRPDMELDTADCYKAVAWITSEYLEAVPSNDYAEMDDELKDPNDFLGKADWVYVSYNDTYPSIMDINMAMERIAAFNLISSNPKLLKEHTNTKKIPYIPTFCPPPYLVDFGYIVLDIPVCYTILMYNYGPISAEIMLMEDNKTALLEKEIKIEYKPKILAPGESVDLYVILSPTKRKCFQLNKQIEDVFRLSVKHGPIITVKVKAEVTLPVVSLQYENLCFENVYVGDVLRKSIILTNHGHVLSKWSGNIIKPSKKDNVAGFFIIPSQGQLQPGKQAYLDIYYFPSHVHKIKRTLRIDVESNSEPVYLFLSGEALEASLMIVPDELTFLPTLSYFHNSLAFVVQNMSEIPLEFYFPSLDRDFEHEKQLIQVYLAHKNVKYVFIPMRIAGAPLPDFFANTYSDLTEKLRKKLTFIREDNEDPQKVQSQEQEKSNASLFQKSGEPEDPLAKYSAKEINSLLIDYITADGFETDRRSNTTTYKMDDSSDKIEIVEAVSKSTSEEYERRSLLFIFHGAPNTAFYRGANQFGSALSIPVYSIDRLIIESIIEGSHPLASDILANIDNALLECVNWKADTLLETLENEDSEYDKILEKIHVILTSKPKKHVKTSTPKEKGSKASSDKSPGKSKDKASGGKGDCFLNIPLDSLVELLKLKLKSIPCLIIESLFSTFIHQENQALYAILRAAGPVHYINLVIFSYTVHDFVKNEEDKLRKAAEKVPIVAEVEKSGPISATPKNNSSANKKGKSSAKSGSEKVSKTSRGAIKSADVGKKILQSLSKSLKVQLEAFENLRQEIWHIAQYWDKQNATLRKPFSLSAGKRDTSNRDSARTARNSMKKPNSNPNIEDTVLDQGNTKNVDYPQMIRNCIKQDEDLRKCLVEMEESQHQKLEETEAMFSVISKISSKKIDQIQSPVFTIKNFQGPDATALQDQSKTSLIKVKRKRSSKVYRKSADSRFAPDLQTLSFAKMINEVEFSPKTVLQAGDLMKYRVTFCPQKSGMHKYKYNIATTRSKEPYQVLCNATCEFPRIDTNAEVMFPRTLDNYREKASYDHFVFIKDQKIFDFGSIVAGTSIDKCLEYSSSILLRNASSSICEVAVSLSNDAFSIESSSFTIPPNGEEPLRVFTKSSKVGTITTQMYISIKNNPVVEAFTLACSPCKLEFSIFPRTVNFDKVPLHYLAKRIVRLTNTSPINLRWEFIEPEWATEIFDLSQTKGFMGLYSVSDIVFRFNPSEEMLITKRHLHIRVFDVNSTRLEPCFTDNLSIHVESVEYNLELENHIEYGDLKGGVDHRTLFPISNRGKCEVDLKIELINNPLESHNFVREYFKIQPLLMSIGPQKADNLSIVFRPKSNFSVQKVLVFVVSMMESIQSGHIVKSYKVTISATSFMPSFEVCPSSQLNFGHLPLLVPKKLKLDVINKGKFPFSFVILNYQKVVESLKKGSGAKKLGKMSENEGKHTRKSAKSEEDSHKTDKEKKSDHKTKTKSAGSRVSKETTSKSDKKKPTKITKLDVGGFTIVSSTGFVAPGEKFTVEVEIAPREIKDYKEKILLNIAEIEDTHKNKVLSLEATGCEPRVNLKDFENVFIEQYIVQNVEDFVVPKSVDGCVIFATSDCSLNFKGTCINIPQSARLNVKNTGFVTAYLAAKVDDGGKNVFSLIPTSKALEPYSSDSLQLVFKPHSLESINGTLELSYNASSDNKLIINLHGQGCLPQIELIQPPVDCGEAYLNFGPVCAGFSKSNRIAFQNIGEIKSKVIVELSPTDDGLSLVPVSETLQVLNIQGKEYLDEMKHNIMVNLPTGKLAQFDVMCKPTQPGLIQATLTLHTIQNPYEVIKIFITSECFDNDIILEGLEPTRTLDSSLNSLSGDKNAIGYFLNLGYKQLNRLYKQSFIIRNRSVDNYRFKFYGSSVLFIPQVGHLKPSAWKEILVIFKAPIPILLRREEVSCNVTKILYVSPNDNLLSWDDRQKFVYWITDTDISDTSVGNLSAFTLTDKTNRNRGKSTSSVHEKRSHFSSLSVKSTEVRESRAETKTKVIMEGGEPEFITVADSFDIIPLYVSVAADYARYECEARFIDFPETFIKEESIQQFEVKNNGTVPLNISWKLIDKNRSLSIRKSSSEKSITLRQTESASLKSVSSSSLLSYAHSHELDKSLPISIDCVQVRIKPDEVRLFSLLFSPQEAKHFEVTLRSKIDSLDPDLEEMCIFISAHALPIPFYFELDGVYVTSKDILVDFENIGVATESTRRVMLANPSQDQVTFEITAQDPREFSYFACDIPRGHIDKKKKCITSFSFRPPIFGSFKEQFVLNIPEQSVKRIIRLQGLCREPNVHFSENNIVLKSTLPKVKTMKSLKLINEESFPVSFKFIKKSLFSESQQEKLEVFPIVGKLKPQSESDIKITFTSSNLVTCNFHLKCLIEKRKSPLGLHISSSCIKVQASVTFVDTSGGIKSLKEDQLNIIDLGSMYKGQKETLQFSIKNKGQTGMFFAWEMDAKHIDHLFKISVSLGKDFIKSGNTAVSDLLVEPIRTGSLKQFKISLNVMYGPIYTLQLNASSEKPNYSFSFNSFNFGHCLVQVGETNYYNTVLYFKNSGANGILLQNMFEKSDWLSVNFSSTVVPAGESCNIPIKFYPQSPGSYKENIPFLLGASKQSIHITGEAVNVKLELCKPKDKFINFGDVLVNTIKKYRVGVFNNSPARIGVHFALYDNLIIHTRKVEKSTGNVMKMPILPTKPKEVKKEKGGKKEEKKKGEKPKDEKSKSDKKSDKAKKKKEEEQQMENRLIAEEQLRRHIEERQEYLKSFVVSPNMYIDIPSRGKGYFDITIQPSKKMEFEEKIYFEIQDYVEPLCVIKGASIVPEFSLDKNEVLFLGIIVGYSTSQYISLRNSGDVIGSFNWSIDGNQRAFIIEPSHGFVLPKNDMKIKITFCATTEKCEQKVKAKCIIKEAKEPLELVVRGNSVGKPEPSGRINLNCKVREKIVDQSVVITNNTSQQWLLLFEVSHDAFSVPKELIVLPSNSSTVPITYFPKKMTLVAPDQGILFIKMPDGSGLIYQLVGNAAPPSANKRIEKEIRCKQNHFENILVENWLTSKQIFGVFTEITSPVTTKTIYQVFGFKSFELKGMESKSYKWGIYVVNEGPIEFKVTFRNSDTGEYQFFEISLKVISREPIEVITFNGRVREHLTQHFTLENPVDVPITYVLEGTEKTLSFPKSVSLEPYTLEKVEVTYSPLQSEDVSTTINAKCEELGTYTFSLKMHADPPKQESPIIFRTELGDKSSKTILIKNTFDRSVDFTGTLDHDEFHVERCNLVAPGDTSKITITFEPSALGYLNSRLVLVSPVAGEYIYPLEGEGILPTPKGPFIAKQTHPAVIEFKNPFAEDRQFKFCLQPSIFSCDFGENVIKARKSTRFVIYHRSGIDTGIYETGKLVISTDDDPEVVWKFYLESSR